MSRWLRGTLGVARAVIVFAALLSPIAALSLWFLTWERRPATVWLILPVATLIWLAAIDLRIGLTARWARPPARAGRAERP